MIWLRKEGAAHSAAFQNVHDAAILWFRREPPQVDATVVRQGVVSQISSTEKRSIERARRVAESFSSWVSVVCEDGWEKFVNMDRVTDVVLEDDPPPGKTRGVRKLVLSVAYVAIKTPYAPQSYECGEVHEHHVIERVLERLGHTLHEEKREEQAEAELPDEEADAVAEATAPPPRPQRAKPPAKRGARA